MDLSWWWAEDSSKSPRGTTEAAAHLLSGKHCEQLPALTELHHRSSHLPLELPLDCHVNLRSLPQNLSLKQRRMFSQ